MENQHIYTKEQIQKLESNPNVYSACATRVVLTKAFKEYYVEERQKPGTTSIKVFRAAGFDEDTMDVTQIYRLASHIQEEYRKKGTFSEPRGKSKEEKLRDFAMADLSRMKQDEAMKQLQDRVVMLEQSVEFLKKVTQKYQSG